MYEYSLGYRASASHSEADALSRLPLTVDSGRVPDPPDVVLLMEHLVNSPVTATLLVILSWHLVNSPVTATLLVILSWHVYCKMYRVGGQMSVEMLS